MKFCMLTTFFGTHSFGGDAAFVDRLSRALARHGHEVHVIHCRDAFEVSNEGWLITFRRNASGAISGFDVGTTRMRTMPFTKRATSRAR